MRNGGLRRMAPSGMLHHVALVSSSETLVLPHGVTSQKTPFFIVTAVKTSNLAEKWSRISCSQMIVNEGKGTDIHVTTRRVIRIQSSHIFYAISSWIAL
jgi:hypothetical protein